MASHTCVVYISGASGDIAIKKNQERIQLILKNAGVNFTVEEITVLDPAKKKDVLEKSNRSKCPIVFFNGEYKPFEEIDNANECVELKEYLGLESN